VTIHSGHPFADENPDPVRRLRGRLGGAVALLTAAGGGRRAGLTVTSLMVANGEPARVLALVDPDSDLAEVAADAGRVVVQLLAWPHRDLADAFAGVAPAPGGPFRMAEWDETGWGPRLLTAQTWAGTRVESAAPVGWSDLLTLAVEEVVVGEDDQPLVHRRGRYLRP
jgi:flavin reductase (DIM6/NTAB) family NADH-FMN oxidoreductase RutF